MVKPSNRAGQRRSAISWRTILGWLGSIKVVSAARAATPAVAATRINFRRVVRGKGNRFEPLRSGITRDAVSASSITRIRKFAICREHCLNQKLNVACSSILRLAAVPGENGPPCRELGTSNSLEPTTAFGFAAFTLLNTLRAFTPRVRL
jgi:hypothetical protein